VTRDVRGVLRGEYSAGLHRYCGQGGEAALLGAYQLGRHAAGQGGGVLEIAALHEELVSDLVAGRPAEEGRRIAKRAAEFFAECLAPFELTRGGFQQLNATLHETNGSLQRRLELAVANFEAARHALVEHKRVAHLKDEIISIISHEVRTPLTSIHGALGLLGAGLGGGLNKRGRRLLEVACRNSERLVRFVSDGLDLQKMETGTMTFDLQTIELGTFLDRAIAANRAYARELGVTLVLGRATRSARVRADADRLTQVMSNLLSNAAKFSPPHRPVVVEAIRQGGMVRISVHDDGPGVPVKFRRRVFQKFAQAASPTVRGGSGLGLSISKAIVERMGGRIAFESSRHGGTTFFFDLPEWRAPRGTGKGAEACAGSV
jgi:signal transduction histidine kinase